MTKPYKEWDYVPRDEELIFTHDDVRSALARMPSDQGEEILTMAKELSLLLPNVSVDSALVLLAEIGSHPHKIKKLLEGDMTRCVEINAPSVKGKQT